jgi:hypothetical protein
MANEQFVHDFFIIFNPETKKYVKRSFNGRMQTVRSSLTEKLITNALDGMVHEKFSFFVKTGKNDYFGIDIDDHKDGGWTNDQPTVLLLEKYDAAIRAIGKKPSVLFCSNRGIHAFWFLKEPIPNKILEGALRKMFKEIVSVEILPTNNHSLAIPSPLDYINTELAKTAFLGFDNMERYSIEEIFGSKNLSEILKQDVADGEPAIKKTNSFNHKKTLEEIEAKILPLKKGQTNAVYKKLVAQYKIHNLSEDEAYNRFAALVHKSPGYSGKLLSGLEDRIRTSYNRMTNINFAQMPSLSDLNRDPKVRLIIDNSIRAMKLDKPARVRMKNSMTDFLLNIISWKNVIDALFKDHEMAYYREYLYPGVWGRYKEGYYPLPYSLLRKWNVHYDRPLKLLKTHGILVESPYGYSTTLKRCKYYQIKYDARNENI